MRAECAEKMIPQSNVIPPIPRETARVAKAVFGHSNFYIQVGEHLEAILEDIQLASLSEAVRDPMAGGATLPLISFFQFVEGLTDAQAADAVRTRIEWKFALHLPINALPFKEYALCEFRRSSVTNPASRLEFQKLIDRLLTFRPPIDNQIEHIKNSQLLFSVCSANRWNWALQAMCQTLETLACKYPDWLRQVALPHWYGRYNHLSPLSASSASICQGGLTKEDIGADIHHLVVAMIYSGNREMNGLQEVKSLYRIWMQEFNTWKESQIEQRIGLTSKDCESCFNKPGWKEVK